MNKEKAFDDSTVRQMGIRALNFLAALKNPTTRIGEKRAQRKPNPDFVAPEEKTISRFSQLDKEDRWSRTEYREGEYGEPENGFAYITVQDPRDPDDLPHRAPTSKAIKERGKHRVSGEHGQARPFYPQKISQLVMIDEEE